MYSKPRVCAGDVVPKLDEEKGELRAGTGEDWIMTSGEAPRRVYENEVLMRGTGACAIWYNAGKAVGKTEGENFVEMIDSMGIDQLASELSKSYGQLAGAGSR